MQIAPNTFARVGMSHVTGRLGEPYRSRMKSLAGIQINTSSQPNANPHFGTLTTLMCVAAIAEELQQYFGRPVTITFDQLENAPDRSVRGLRRRVIDRSEVEYQLSLADSITESGEPLVDMNMRAFRELFDFFQQQTGIVFAIRSYRACQADPFFRKSLLQMFNNPELFGSIVAPGDEIMRLRFPCPTCRWVDKGSVHTRIVSRTADKIVFVGNCPDHGDHQAILSIDSDDFFDTNTALRDIAKVPSLIEAGRRDSMMPLMIDGRDWSGRWDRCVHIPGITHLGYGAWDLPARIYPPTVTDTLGAKLSKSLYVGSSVYSKLAPGFADFRDFMQVYGEAGLIRLWQHVREWAQDPAYMDRDSYTVTYFTMLLAGTLGPAQLMG